MPKEFIDKYAMTGRPRLKSVATIKTEPSSNDSRLRLLLKDEHIRFELFDDGSDLKVNLTKLHSSHIRIKKDNAMALAKWILSNYE